MSRSKSATVIIVKLYVPCNKEKMTGVATLSKKAAGFRELVTLKHTQTLFMITGLRFCGFSDYHLAH